VYTAFSERNETKEKDNINYELSPI